MLLCSKENISHSFAIVQNVSILLIGGAYRQRGRVKVIEKTMVFQHRISIPGAFLRMISDSVTANVFPKPIFFKS